MSGMRNEMERLISTALHCNPQQFVYGTVTGTTITFGISLFLLLSFS